MFLYACTATVQLEVRGQFGRTGSILLPHGSEDWTHVVRLRDGHLYPVHHLTGLFSVLFETESPFVAQENLELTVVILPQSVHCWIINEPPHWPVDWVTSLGMHAYGPVFLPHPGCSAKHHGCLKSSLKLSSWLPVWFLVLVLIPTHVLWPHFLLFSWIYLIFSLRSLSANSYIGI